MKKKVGRPAALIDAVPLRVTIEREQHERLRAWAFQRNLPEAKAVRQLLDMALQMEALKDPGSYLEAWKRLKEMQNF